jgi:hypothetical protein
MFPTFLTICIAYSLKLDILRVRMGSIVAVIGGIGLMAFPVTTYPHEHTVWALVVFLSSWFWYPECNGGQFWTFGISSVFFIGGYVIDQTDDAKSLAGMFRYLPSICCMVGELGIFITWGSMVQNVRPHRQNPLKRRDPAAWGAA